MNVGLSDPASYIVACKTTILSGEEYCGDVDYVSGGQYKNSRIKSQVPIVGYEA